MIDDIKNLVTYYNRAPDQLLLKYVFGLIGNATDEDQRRVVDWIINNIPKRSGLDIPTLKAAMRELGVGVPQEAENPTPWTCDLCGVQFRRVTISSEPLRRRGIHDYCPRCGLAPADTDNAAWHAQRFGGKTPQWYVRLKEDIAKEHLVPGAKPRYDPKSDDAYDAEMKRQRIEKMKTEFQEEAKALAQAKRVAV